MYEDFDDCVKQIGAYINGANLLVLLVTILVSLHFILVVLRHY